MPKIGAREDVPAEAPGGAPRRSGALRGTFAPNDLLAGRFVILRFIAAGGMGEVYEAEDRELKERVALKTVRPEIAEDQTVMERFHREIQLARRVTHPSVCRSFDLFRQPLTPPPGWEGPTPVVTFLTMELLEGQTLAERLRSKGRMTTEEALPIVQQVGSALAAAHEAGIVHRDFKSANVVLVPSKKAEKGARAVVTDFGLARGGTTSAGRGKRTTATLAGTPAYMAPEQVEGGEITPATDVYALGVVIYEMVTGKWPFEGDTPLQTAVKRLKQKPPSPRTHVPGLDPQWEAAILRCLERDPADRFASAAEVAKALTGEPIALPPRRRRRRAVVMAAALALLLAGGAAWLVRAPWRTPPVTSRPETVKARRSVAVLGFKNLSGRDDAAWLTKALSEMLVMELGAGDKLRTIPGENVARTKVELSLPEAERLAPDTLNRIRTNLGTDLVVLGSYFASGKDSGGKLRVDLHVQDTAAGDTVASVSRTGSEAELLDLVSRAGSELRRKLGAGELSAAEAGGVKAALPSNPGAARLYAEGLDRLRLFDAQAARDLLEKAVGADPRSPLTHAALATAWSALGYDAKALQEAKRAFDLSPSLSREDRLLVEGRYHEAAKDWEKAIEVYQTLWGFFPDSLDYGLRLAEVQSSSGKAKDALMTAEALRKLPKPASDDPRIDLAEARAAESLSDYKRCQASAAKAAEKGAALGARLLVAQARFQEGRALWLLGETKRATAAAEESKRVFAEVGDRAGVARALNLHAVVLLDQGELDPAKAAFEETLAIALEIGNQERAAAALNNIAEVLRLRGDLAGAKSRYEECLRIDRAIDDKVGSVIDLDNIGEVLRRQGDLAGAQEALGEALRLSRETGYKRGLALSLDNIAHVLHRRGDIAEASRTYQEALGLWRETGEKSDSTMSLSGAGELAAAQGDLSAARKRYEEALAIREELGDKGGAAQARLALAALALEQGHPGEAEASARQAAEVLRKEQRADDEAMARAVLARSLLEQGKAAEAHTTIGQALALSTRSQDLEVRMTVAIAGGRVKTATGRSAEAIKTLAAALADATKAGFYNLQLEARLALGQIEMKSGNSAAGRARLEALEKDAAAKGFGLIAGKARRAQS